MSEAKCEVKFKKLFVDVPSNIYWKLKVKAAQQEMFLKDLVNKLIASYVSN
jgi:hypothetical protein